MFKGASVDIKGRRMRLKFQEKQRLQQKEIKQPWGTGQTDGRLGKFATKLIK